MAESWALYIEEEGFAQHWDHIMAAFSGLNAMMEAICRIGIHVFPDPGDRLFCYQFGDGFLVTSDFHEKDLSRAALISIAILRHVLAASRVARASLVEGEMSDIAGCYPKEVRKHNDRTTVAVGAGLLLTSPVLGEGLLRSVSLGKKEPRGPLFLINAKLASRLNKTISSEDIGNGVAIVDWLNGEPEGLADIPHEAKLNIHSSEQRVEMMRNYLADNRSMSPEWRSSVYEYLLEKAAT